MVRYSTEPANPERSCKARAANLKVHFKNTRETVHAIKNKTVAEALRYINDVLEFKDIIPFRRFNGGVGRHAQAKKYKTSQGRWPKKSCLHVRTLLEQLAANGKRINISPEELHIIHAQVNRAAKRRRRTYRAYGRINSYTSSPCHVEFIASAVPEEVKIGKGKKFIKKGVLRSGDSA